ncbi:MAG: type II toxin-antitoxin system VapC family toxin [bacterium]|nr:type II toxin-antitoxin system VapC family toxin [bacterium]
MYTLDTNAIIYCLKKDDRAVIAIQNILAQNVPIYISTITELELFGYPNLTAEEAGLIEMLLETFSIIPVDSRIARIAGSLRRSHRIKTLDAAIAATALSTGSILLTRNIKDFQRIPNLKISEV